MASRTRIHSGSASRRARARLLLAIAVAVCGAIPLMVSVSLWPLALVPVPLAVVLGGPVGLVLAAATSAGVFGAIAGAGLEPAATLATAWAAVVVPGFLLGARHVKVARDLERVAGASLLDQLTGLYNFAFFSDALRRECNRVSRYGGGLSLVLFDLDGFKSFNDTWGHHTGNVLLEQVGRTIASSRREADIAARFGGEEFALLVPGSAEMAVEAAERIRRAVGRIAVDVGKGQHDGRTISAGIAAYHRGESPDRLVERADRALYRSKRRGRNRVSVAGETPLRQVAG